MPLRKRQEKIPPVQPSHLDGPSPRPSPRPYQGSRSAPGPNHASDPPSERYSRNEGVGVADMYARTGRKVQDDRNELLAGYDPEKLNSNRFVDGPGLGREPPPGEEEEEDVEGIKQQTRFIKQESVNTTRNALRMAREAEETAKSTLVKLGDQSEKLANTERHLELSNTHSNRASDNTSELKKLNRSIFIPVIHFKKDRLKEEARIQAEYEESRQEYEKTAVQVRETHDLRAKAFGMGGEDEEEEEEEGIAPRRHRSAEQQAQRKAQRKRFQFEATASDDEIEDELDDNLDEVLEATKRLKNLGLTMGQELDNQNSRIGRIEQKTVKLDNKIHRNTERLKRVN